MWFGTDIPKDTDAEKHTDIDIPKLRYRCWKTYGHDFSFRIKTGSTDVSPLTLCVSSLQTTEDTEPNRLGKANENTCRVKFTEKQQT